MPKSLLILMLMTTQLLAGTCGSLHLCIANDGSCYCFDLGPESCNCCRNHAKEQQDPDCPTVSHCCKHCSRRSAEPDTRCDVNDGRRDCTHIPLAVASDEPRTVVRSTSNEAIERFSCFVALLPVFASSDELLERSPCPTWFEPPVVPDFALTVISMVVIRC